MSTAPTRGADLTGGSTDLDGRVGPQAGGPPSAILAFFQGIAKVLDTRGGGMVFSVAALYVVYAFILQPMQVANTRDRAADQKVADSNAVTAGQLSVAMRDLNDAANTLKETALIQSGGASARYPEKWPRLPDVRSYDPRHELGPSKDGN